MAAKRTRKKGQLSARQAMHAKRAVAPEINPCPPGPNGGQYRPLTEADIKKIYAAALKILSELYEAIETGFYRVAFINQIGLPVAITFFHPH